MPHRSAVTENLKFLIIEATSQVDAAYSAMKNPGSISLEKLAARDDYIDNLKGNIESKCFSQILHAETRDESIVRSMKASLVVATNLERIADFAINVVSQIEHYENPSTIQNYGYEPFFREFYSAIALIEQAMAETDVKLALQICQAELVIDGLYEKEFQRLRQQLSTGRDTADLLTTIFIFRYLERIGDSLLNIGEAVISSAVGEKLKIHQFRALEDTLEEVSASSGLTDLKMKSIWETRSGCRIGQLEGRAGDSLTKPVIFKHGNIDKIARERDALAMWEELFPGLPPQVFGYEERGKSGLLLLEYLSGTTLLDLVLNSSNGALESALDRLTALLDETWERTLERGPVNARPFAQLRDRLDRVMRVHPEYDAAGDQIGTVSAPSLVELIDRASPLEEVLDAPFSVLTHGDFNVDNIIYNNDTDRIHFIDLHRSSRNDYLQDVSVFIVSNFRVPPPSLEAKGRLDWIIQRFLGFVRDFGDRHDDETVDARLTLGLIRSLVSSTRFELEREFATAMLNRAVFLLEKLAAHHGRPWSQFKFPQQALTR